MDPNLVFTSESVKEMATASLVLALIELAWTGMGRLVLPDTPDTQKIMAIYSNNLELVADELNRRIPKSG